MATNTCGDGVGGGGGGGDGGGDGDGSGNNGRATESIISLAGSSIRIIDDGLGRRTAGYTTAWAGDQTIDYGVAKKCPGCEQMQMLSSGDPSMECRVSQGGCGLKWMWTEVAESISLAEMEAAVASAATSERICSPLERWRLDLDNFNLIEEVNATRHALGAPPHPYPNPLLLWQDVWEEKCSRLCCWATNCAEIKCSVCFISLVKPLRTRYSCMECRIEVEGPDGDATMLTVCEDCFNDPIIPHGTVTAQHKNFCKIDADGVHTLAVRPVSSDIHELKQADLKPLDEEWQKIAADSLCPVCYCEFDAENLAYGSPACTNPDHAVARHDCPHAVKCKCELKIHWICEPFHQDCLYMTLKSKNLHQYCGDNFPPASYFCSLCKEERIRTSWERDIWAEFTKFRTAFESLNSMQAKMDTGMHGHVKGMLLQTETFAVWSADLDSKLDNLVTSRAAMERENGGRVQWAECLGIFKEMLKFIHPQEWIQQLIQDGVAAPFSLKK